MNEISDISSKKTIYSIFAMVGSRASFRTLCKIAYINIVGRYIERVRISWPPFCPRSIDLYFAIALLFHVSRFALCSFICMIVRGHLPERRPRPEFSARRPRRLWKIGKLRGKLSETILPVCGMVNLTPLVSAFSRSEELFSVQTCVRDGLAANFNMLLKIELAPQKYIFLGAFKIVSTLILLNV